MATHSERTGLTSGVDRDAGQPPQEGILLSGSALRNRDGHHDIQPGDEVHHPYLDSHPGKMKEKLAKAMGLTDDVGFCSKFLGVIIFGATLVAAGVMPITVTWAKEGLPHYPFMVSVWLVCFKIVILLISFVMYFIAKGQEVPGGKKVSTDMPMSEKWKLGLILLPPAAMYTMADLLTFPIIAMTDAATATTLNQMKIVVVALLHYFVLRRQVHMLQWVAVVQLLFASFLYKVYAFEGAIDGLLGNASSGQASSSAGIVLILIKVFIASAASVWCDWSFKQDKGAHHLSYPEQQIFFAFWTVVFALGYFFTMDYSTVLASGRPLFDGFDMKAIICLLVFAGYGILVSVFVKLLDSLMKLVMNLLAVILTAVLDSTLFGTKVSIVQDFSIAFIVIGAVLFKLGTTHKKPAAKKQEKV